MNIPIPATEYKELLEHSRMLSRIAAYVEDFCEEEEDTTLAGVLRLLAEYHELKADYNWKALEKLNNETK